MEVGAEARGRGGTGARVARAAERPGRGPPVHAAEAEGPRRPGALWGGSGEGALVASRQEQRRRSGGQALGTARHRSLCAGRGRSRFVRLWGPASIIAGRQTVAAGARSSRLEGNVAASRLVEEVSPGICHVLPAHKCVPRGWCGGLRRRQGVHIAGLRCGLAASPGSPSAVSAARCAAGMLCCTRLRLLGVSSGACRPKAARDAIYAVRECVS